MIKKISNSLRVQYTKKRTIDLTGWDWQGIESNNPSIGISKDSKTGLIRFYINARLSYKGITRCFPLTSEWRGPLGATNGFETDGSGDRISRLVSTWLHWEYKRSYPESTKVSRITDIIKNIFDDILKNGNNDLGTIPFALVWPEWEADHPNFVSSASTSSSTSFEVETGSNSPEPPVEPVETNPFKRKATKEDAKRFMDAMQKFASPFKNRVNLCGDRHVDTLRRIASTQGKEAAIAFFVNRFKVMDFMADEVDAWTHSPEFEEILKNPYLYKMPTCEPVNKYLRIAFGAPSTGKSTAFTAIADTKITASPASQFDDYTKQLTFVDGKPQWSLGSLALAAMEGKKWFLDETTLASNDVLQELQAWCDNTPYVDLTLPDTENEGPAKVVRINKAPGFEVLMAFNLEDHNGTRPLPEALVDRAYSIEEYITNPEVVIDRLDDDLE